MKHIIAASIGLVIVVLSGVSLNYWFNKEPEYSGYHENEIDISFKVTGSAAKPVDFIKFNITVKKDGVDQGATKAECDSAADSMLQILSEIKEIKIDPKGIEVDKETDYETKKSKIIVARTFEVILSDINQMESIIGKISKIEGCLIQSTEYHSNKVSEIRQMAVADGKKKMDEYCMELLAMYAGKRLRIHNIRIDDEDRWGGSGSCLMAAPSGNENLQNAQMMKNVEIKISYDVSVYISQ